MNIRRRLEYWYVWAAAGVLGVSTLVWSLVIARLRQGNADQLADGFLFTSTTTFRQAVFPEAHTLLMKWPLFWLLGRVHNTPVAYVVITVLLSLAAVGAFAYLLYRIVHRPATLALLYVSLACVLVLVPAQVQGAVSAPLGMAMVTGRNVEYPLYIAVLVLLLPSIKWRWWRWSGAIVLLGLLFASDHLFVGYSLGGAVLLLLLAYSLDGRSLLHTAWRWLAATGVAWLLAWFVIKVLRQFTVVAGSALSPYGHITNATNLHTAVTYGLKGLLLNFGINLDAGWLAILPALMNVAVLAASIYAAAVLGRKLTRGAQLGRAETLSLLLVLSTLMAFVLYVGTDHPYAADARYLSISLFAGFVVLTTQVRTMRLNVKSLYVSSALLVGGVVLGAVGLMVHVGSVAHHNQLAVRNQRVVQALAAHPVQLLVGDYWRVLPIKEHTPQASQAVEPLASCLQPRQLLASGVWNQDLYTHSFAYLLSPRPVGTPFGGCNLQTIVLIYGRPTNITVIAGSRQSPAELLLFYNNGASKLRGNMTEPLAPVFGVPTAGVAKPTGSTMVPLAAPSASKTPPSVTW